MKNVSESLAGRADIVELETLSFSEIRAALPETGIEAAIVRGGFPELYANPDIDLVAFYNSYLATYLERDVRLLTNVGNLRDFERFVRAHFALQTCSIRLIWRAMSASLLQPRAIGYPCWRHRGKSSCLNRGSRTAPSPLSKAQSSILPIPASSAPY